MKGRLIATIITLVLLPAQILTAQIQNRMNVDDAIFQRYAYGRMQQYNRSNLALADSIYLVGQKQEDPRLMVLGLSLEMPARYASGDFSRMDSIMSEAKSLLLSGRKKSDLEFLYPMGFDYCQLLLSIGRASDAMLEAREMERDASENKNALGKMFAYRIIGQIQAYRSNSVLAIRNYQKAVDYCIEAKQEQELPNLYILIAQEMIKLHRYEEAIHYRTEAEKYQDFFPSLKVKTTLTNAYLLNSEGKYQEFWDSYDKLTNDPLYHVQVDKETRNLLEIYWLRSRGAFYEAIALSDSLGTARDQLEQKYQTFAVIEDYRNAYTQLHKLMEVKDSIYIAVQNEDMAILDAEMNNAQLRQDAARLKSQHQATVLIGVILMFGIAFSLIYFSMWNLRNNLEELRRKNREMLNTREVYRHALSAKESENAMKVKLIQNSKNNVYRL